MTFWLATRHKLIVSSCIPPSSDWLITDWWAGSCDSTVEVVVVNSSPTSTGIPEVVNSTATSPPIINKILN